MATKGSNDLDDHQLIARWRSGDDKAGAQLVQRHSAAVESFFRSRARDNSVDLAQSVWLGCVESRDRIPEGIPFRRYLMGISRRILFQHFRRRRRTASELQEAEVGSNDESALSLICDQFDESVLLLALRRLPEEMQRTFELFYWKELKLAEIAMSLRISPGTVKSRLSRMRTRLRTVILELEASRSQRLNLAG